eukprot:20928-Pleurochrysis_carterae.AAC.1
MPSRAAHVSPNPGEAYRVVRRQASQRCERRRDPFDAKPGRGVARARRPRRQHSREHPIAQR